MWSMGRERQTGHASRILYTFRKIFFHLNFQCLRLIQVISTVRSFLLGCLDFFFPFHPFSRSVAIWSDSLPSSLREPPSGSMASIRTPRRSPWSWAWCSAGQWNLRLPQAVEHGDPYSWGNSALLASRSDSRKSSSSLPRPATRFHMRWWWHRRRFPDRYISCLSPPPPSLDASVCLAFHH